MSDDRIYILEIEGKPVLAFPAHSFREAQSLLKEDWLLDDLRALKSHGTAVWDGKNKPVVRNADVAEGERFAQESKGNTDDLPIVYLIDRS
jgi:predicted metal-dependent phosphoesterase TrpH